jgi:molybdopterin-binding protein
VVAIPILLVLFSLIMPASAQMTWSNHIILKKDSMEWNYNESYTNSSAILYRDYIDSQLGDDSGLVNAWEVLKMDVKVRNYLKGELEEEMDVQINGSSENIQVTDIAAQMGFETLGNINKTDRIDNRYSVDYIFDTPVLNSDTNFTFRGQNQSEVVIELADTVEINSTAGMENVIVSEGENTTFVRGNIGNTSYFSLYLE